MLRVVIDTHVFLKRTLPQILKNGNNILKVCEKVVLTPKIVNEYAGRAHSHNYRTTDVQIAIQKLRAMKKMVWKAKSACKGIKVPNKEVQRDAHLIKAGRAAHAKYIITRDRRDLLDHKDKIEREFKIEVVTPEQFLECAKSTNWIIS